MLLFVITEHFKLLGSVNPAKLGVDTAFLKGYLDTAKHLRAAAEPVLLPEICRRVRPEQESISSSPGNNKNKEQLDL